VDGRNKAASVEEALMKADTTRVRGFARGFGAHTPTAQMFHGVGKGLGRGRGPKLAEVPVSKGQPVMTRGKTELWHATLVNR
jgi:hypothetical protein